MVNEFGTSKGRGLLGIFEKEIIFILETLHKMLTKLGQLTKPGPFYTFQLLKLSQFCDHFCRVLKKKIFILIFLLIPRPLPFGIQ